MRKLDRPEPRIEVRRDAGRRRVSELRDSLRAGLPTLIEYLERAANRCDPTRRFSPSAIGRADGDADVRARHGERRARSRPGSSVMASAPTGRRVMILSENSIEHALLTFGALRAGATVMPVSPTYSFGADLGRLGYALELIEPGLVFAKDGARYAQALNSRCAGTPRLDAGAGGFAEMLQRVDDDCGRGASQRRSRATRSQRFC